MDKNQISDRKKNIGRKIIAAIPSIDDYPSRQEWERSCWRRISGSRELLELFMTSYGRRDLVMRAAAVKGLVLRKSYRQISKEFFVSLQTISTAKKAMDENGYRSYSERSKKERKKKKYSVSPASSKPKYRRVFHRTKYGKLYLPS